MDTMNDLFMRGKAFFLNIYMPYKHTTIESVYQDSDIENQYEKICVSGIVGTGNVLVNLLILKMELIRDGVILLKKTINDMMTPQEEVTIINPENHDFEVVPDKKND